MSDTSDPVPLFQQIVADTVRPDVDDVISADGETFGAFTKRVLGRHYSDQAFKEAED